MAVKGTFYADFKPFYDAVAKADVVLKEFGEGSAAVGVRLSKMTDGFTGRKLIEDANLMAQAVERVGGVSALTAKELETVGAKAAEAVEKMRAMGMNKDIPASLQALADNAKAAGTATVDAATKSGLSFNDLSAAIKNPTAALEQYGTNLAKYVIEGGGASVAAIGAVIASFVALGVTMYNAAVHSREIGTKLADIAEVTRVAVPIVSNLKFAFEAAGSSIDTAAGMMETLDQRLGNNFAEVSAGLKDLKIDVDQFKAASSDQRLLMLSDAMRAAGPEVNRVADAVKILGKSGKEDLGILLKPLTDLTDESRTLGATWTNENAQAANKFTDSLNHLKAQSAATWEAIGVGVSFMDAITYAWERGKLAVANLAYDLVALGKLITGASWWQAWLSSSKDIPPIMGDAAKGVEKLHKQTAEYANSLPKITVGEAEMNRIVKESDDTFKKSSADRKKALDDLKKAQDAYAASLRQLVDQFSGGGAIDKANLWRQALDRTIPTYQMTRSQQDAVNKTMEDAIDAYRALGEQAPAWMYALANATRKPVEAMDDLAKAIKDLPTVAPDKLIIPTSTITGVTTLTQGLEGVRTPVSHLGGDLLELGRTFESLAGSADTSFGVIGHAIGIASSAMGDFFKQVPGETDAQGLSRRWGAIAQAASAANQLARDAGASPWVQALTGAAAGGAAGFAAGGNPYVAAGMAVYGGVTSYFSASSQRDDQQRQIRQQLQEVAPGGFGEKDYVREAEGVRILGERARQAGIDFAAFNDAYTRADDPGKIAIAINDINAAFQHQQESMQTLIDTATRYGLSLEDLGPAMERADMDKRAAQLFQDFTLLTTATGDMSAAVGHLVTETTKGTDDMGNAIDVTSSHWVGMHDALLDYTHDALRMGIEVPESMRPMLQRMVDMGELTDLNGQKITDLNESGLTFSQTMTEGFREVVDSVRQMSLDIQRALGVQVPKAAADAKSSFVSLQGAVTSTAGAVGGLGTAINNLPSSKNIDINYNQRTTGTAPGGNVVDLEGYKRGTDGYRNFGAGTPVMLHGWEAVVPRDASSTSGPPLLDTFDSGGSDAPPIQIVVNAQGAFFDTPDSMQKLADKIAQALTAKYALTNKFRAA